VMFAAVAGAIAAKLNPPPVGVKPDGLDVMQERQNFMVTDLIDDTSYRYTEMIDTPVPLRSDVPLPSETRRFRSLEDNLLNSLHNYYKLPEEYPASEFVTKWRADEGSYMTEGNARLLALENNIAWLISLEIYRDLHPVAIFDEDLEYARRQIDAIFDEDWHTVETWPVGVYFDLIRLYEFTGNDKYLDHAERFVAGDGPDDLHTPLAYAKGLAHRFQFGSARSATPFNFFHAALLADWANRHDEVLMVQADAFFDGLQNWLYDSRFKLLYKRVASQSIGPGLNITETFSTLDQLIGIIAILEYWERTDNPEALSLARAVMKGVYDSESMLSQTAPEQYAASTFYGLYTTYDHGRDAFRFEPGEATMVHVLLFKAMIRLNSATTGAYRSDIEFLESWMEDAGPLYSQYVNGYYVAYDEGWIVNEENNWISSKAAIWMARALVEDDLYRSDRAQDIIPENVPGSSGN